MVDAELVETARPLLELASIGDPERDVVEPDPELAEIPLRRRRRVLVQSEELSLVADQIDL